MKRKVCVVVTARPSYSRIKTALQAIKGHSDLELQLVVGSSAMLGRYGDAVKVIEADGFDIAAKIFNIVEGETLVTMPKTTGLALMELSTVLDNLKPDAVVTIADRYETIATSIAAAFMNIPLIHIQGGEITGSIDEKVRHANTKLADLHLVSTELAAKNVIRMGEDPEAVHVTGCPSIDIACKVMTSSTLDFDPFAKYGGVGAKIDLSNGYIVVLQHPVTNEHETARRDVTETLHAVNGLGIPVLWFWPNVDAGSDGTSKGIRAFRELHQPKNIHFFISMEPLDFLQLLYNSQGIVGNSSVAIRECSFLGIPAVNIGSRQVNRERGRNVIDVSYGREEILEAVRHQISRGKYESDTLYGSGDAGNRIAEHIARVPLTTFKQLQFCQNETVLPLSDS